MAFNDTYRESIQTKHLANVGFTSTAKGVTNEAFALANPHQVLASQIPSVDVVGTYGALVVDGINAGLVEKHTVKLTADPTVNNNKAWIATEDNCTESGHSARGVLRLGQWMRYAGTQYKLRLYEDTGSNAPDYAAEILPSEVSFNWEYDASAGVVYFDADPSGFSKTLPLWGELYTYTGDSVADSLSTTTSGLTAHTHVEADITDLDKYTQAEVDTLISTTSGTLQSEINTKSDVSHNHDSSYSALGHNHDSSYDALGAASSAVSGHELAWDHDSFATHTEVSTVSGVLQDQIDSLNLDFATDAELAAVSGTLQSQIDALDDTYATDAELAAVSGTLQGAIDQNTSDISSLDSELTTASGYLQSQIDALDDTYATDAELSAVSGTLQNQIDNLDDTYATDSELSTAVNDLTNVITTASGYLQSQIDSLDDTYATDAELASVSGSLQYEITNNYNTLDSKIDTTSGTLQSEIEALDLSLNTAIIWEVVDTPYDQIRPKAEHMGKAIYTSGNLTIGGDLTVSGTTTTINSQELTVTDKIITVNNGEVGAGITGEQYAGIEVDRGSETNYLFVFDEAQDNFRVGISGSLQAVATREDTPTDGYVAIWNASEYRFDTSTSIALGDLATDAELSAVSGTLQSAIGAVALDLSSNYYTITQLDSGQLDNRYYTETEIDLLLSSTSGTLQSQIDTLDAKIDTTSGTLQSEIEALDIEISTISGTLQSEIDALDAEISTASGTLQSEIDALDSKIDTTSGTLQSEINAVALDLSTNYYTSVEVDSLISVTSGTLQSEINAVALDLSTNYYTSGEVDTLLTGYSTTGHSHSEADITDLDKYTQTEVNNLLAAQDSFLELDDTIDVYNSGRILFTTASGVVDNTAFTFNSVAGTLNVTGIQLGTGGIVNEIVTTVTSGTTDSQIPTAKAVWDLTEAAASAVHTHFDVDAVHVTDTSWTYGSGFSTVPESLAVYVNGMKNRVGADNDYTVDVPGGVLTITFLYSVKTDFWVNITYIE